MYDYNSSAHECDCYFFTSNSFGYVLACFIEKMKGINRQGLYIEQVGHEVIFVTCTLKILGSNVDQDINALD
jgi:hypothetical protein